jgi:hypothetical protein
MDTLPDYLKTGLDDLVDWYTPLRALSDRTAGDN